MNYCQTCATMEGVRKHHMHDGTPVYLCDDCLRDFWADFLSDASEDGKAYKYMREGTERP